MSNFSSIDELSLDGFQIVRADMFAHLPRKSDATCTLWPTKISFSKLCLINLNMCEYVRLEVNPNNKCLLLVPVSSQDKDSIRWIKGNKDQQVRNMESKTFGDQIYQSWKLDPAFNYRARGRLVTANKKLMMLFDFSDAEMWRNKNEASSNQRD